MKSKTFTVEKDGFYGAWYPNSSRSRRGIILMLGDSSQDRMAECGARWMQKQGCHVLAMSPGRKDDGHDSYPLERGGEAIALL